MTSKTWIEKFTTSQSGSTATLFAAALVPILAFIGSAVDYGIALRVRTQMQSSVDAAVLASAHLGLAESGDLTAYALKHYVANGGAPEALQDFELEVVPGGQDGLTISARGRIKTRILPVVGIGSIDLGVVSRVAVGANELELALVLDNTGSMQGGRLDALKSAAGDLVDTLKSIEDADNKIKIGLVPFAQYVNVGVGSRDADWMSVPDDYSDTADSCYDTYPDAVASNCQTVDNTCYNDGVPYSCQQQQCDWDYGNPVSVCSPTTWTYQWYGCAGSRNSPLDTTRDIASGDPVPGVLNAACPTELTRLSADFDGLGTKILDMVAVGETYIPSGLEWGWRVLSPGAPYADATDKAVKPDIRKVMVLMTDGANTKSATYPDHKGSDAAAANVITAELCTKIKADGIELFTVAFDVDNAAALEMLQTCATSETHALTAETAAELASVFQSIGQSLVALRLTQ